MDFGIAKVLGAGSRTQVGARAVTPGYSPPQQYGTAPTDQRSDIYALRTTLYFAVTGQVPPEAIDRFTGRTDKLIPPTSLNPTIPAEIERVILKAMRVNPQERFATTAVMKAALEAAFPLRPTAPSPAHKKSLPSPSAASLPSTLPIAPLWLRVLAFLFDAII